MGGGGGAVSAAERPSRTPSARRGRQRCELAARPGGAWTEHPGESPVLPGKAGAAGAGAPRVCPRASGVRGRGAPGARSLGKVTPGAALRAAPPRARPAAARCPLRRPRGLLGVGLPRTLGRSGRGGTGLDSGSLGGGRAAGRWERAPGRQTRTPSRLAGRLGGGASLWRPVEGAGCVPRARMRDRGQEAGSGEARVPAGPVSARA